MNDMKFIHQCLINETLETRIEVDGDSEPFVTFSIKMQMGDRNKTLHNFMMSKNQIEELIIDLQEKYRELK